MGVRFGVQGRQSGDVGLSTQDIGWIDEFVKGISEYVYARERDSLLILLPNQAYKLNPTGLALLKMTLSGKPVKDVLESKTPGLSEDEQVIKEVHEFFCDVRALVMGCLREGQGRNAVETVPFERPHNTLPVLSEIALTYRCNLSCRFCYAGCTCSKKSNAQEMTTDQVKRVLDIIRHDAEVPSVSWTGGEPTLRDDLAELTRHATDIGMRVNLITNGTTLNENRVRKLRDAGLRSAQVSLEGHDAKTHDSLTQVTGSFAATIRGIEILRDANLHVHTNTTVNRINAPHLCRIVELAKQIGMTRLSMNMVIPCGTAPDAEVTISYSDMAVLAERVRRKSRQEGIEFLWYSPTPYCIYNPVAAGLGGKSCAACDGLLSIAPNGDVLPCSSLPQGVGNLLESSFDRVWNSRKARFWRNKRYAHRICRKCAHFDICTGACPIYWNAMGCKELMKAGKEMAA